jgi:hypothetical protein
VAAVVAVLGVPKVLQLRACAASIGPCCVPARLRDAPLPLPPHANRCFVDDACRERFFQSGYPWLVLQQHPRRVAVKMADAVLVLARGPRPAPQKQQGEEVPFNAVLHKDMRELENQQVLRAPEVACTHERSPWMPLKKRCGSKACVSPVCLFFPNQVGACEGLLAVQ